ncbi:MAG: hypothetical protein FWF88_13280 [Peptococcaceae bacterium]|nr:hypothetical protein [Peptococcaceae bacterium]
MSIELAGCCRLGCPAGIVCVAAVPVVFLWALWWVHILKVQEATKK